MRFKNVAENTRRMVRRFLFIPWTIEGKTRWLEWANIQQRMSYGYGTLRVWVDECWVTDEVFNMPDIPPPPCKKSMSVNESIERSVRSMARAIQKSCGVDLSDDPKDTTVNYALKPVFDILDRVVTVDGRDMTIEGLKVENRDGNVEAVVDLKQVTAIGTVRPKVTLTLKQLPSGECQ